MYCPKCGEANKDTAKFCNNCAAPLSGPASQAAAPSAASPPPQASPTSKASTRSAGSPGRPFAAFGLAILAVLGMTAVSLTMSFFDDAPGYDGSTVAGIFHAVGAVQLLLGLGVLVSAMFLLVRGFDLEMWGMAILGLGVISILAMLVIVAEGTFAVIFLALPGFIAMGAGYLAWRKGANAKMSPAKPA